MPFDILIPVTLFICLAFSIKAVVDARARGKLVSAGGSEELVRTVLASEEERRRSAGLRWGILFLSLALGFALIEALGWKEITPGVMAVLLAATGLGNLASFVAGRRVK